MLSRKRYSLASVEHARHAVRILDEDIRERVVAEAFPQHQLDEAKELLQWAEEDAATLPEDFVEDDEPAEEAEDEIDEDEEDNEDEEEEVDDGEDDGKSEEEEVEEEPTGAAPLKGVSIADRLGKPSSSSLAIADPSFR